MAIAPLSATPEEVTRRWYRLHKSTYAIVTAVSCTLVLATVPGQVTVHDGCWGDRWNKYEHGWPSVYLERWTLYHLDDEELFVDVDAVPWRHKACWRLGNRSSLVGLTKFRPALLAFDATCSLMVVGVVVALAEWRRRRRLSVWQCSISELLALLTVCGASLGYWRWQHDRHVNAIHLSEQLDSAVNFKSCYIGPRWLGRLVGTGVIEDFKGPVEADLFRDVGRMARELAAHRDTLCHLRKVDVSFDAEISSQFIADVSELPDLERLRFRGCKLDDRIIARINAVRSLQELSLLCCRGMSDAALAKLRANGRIADLSIVLTPLSTDDSKADEPPHAE